MARVKVSKVPVSERLQVVTNILVAQTKSDNYAAGYVYACGYLESVLDRAVMEMPPGKREKFLSGLEKQVGMVD